MSNLPYIEQYRPTLHFSPLFGWMNDPNGLVYSNGVWHLFYQHYPMDTVWGPMHWGHAVSTDLVTWQHLPVALAPDVLGYIFSGSAVIDQQNTSGLFKEKSCNNLVAFYTASLNLPQHKMIDIQSQCVAYSTDGGMHWQKYHDNPVVSNPFIGCFRDPKVIWHEASQHWIMVVTCGQSIGFYRSKNLIDWQKTSEFGQQDGFHSQGPWECPDLLEMPLTNGRTKWVLIVGIGSGCFEDSSGTQYFVGDFDGETFRNNAPSSEVKWLDIGRDYYATQTWFNAPNQRHVGISWFSNWQYARNTDTECFRSSMTAVKEFRLVQNENGDHLHQTFASEMLQGVLLQKTDSVLNGLYANVFYLKGFVNFAEKQTACITLFDGELSIRLHKTDDVVIFELFRCYQGKDDVMRQKFPHHYQVNQAFSGECFDFELLVDHGLTEFHFGNGKVSISQLAFPAQTKTTPQLSGDWQTLEFAIIEV
ncbi:glycoside hydrolase family 32 protein [Glaesserella sp.]|uniref:glycoside hydrolase family 32 protein n=1 Tax=Glaesserella sp. TaxID=2094731 RepID=UPI00359FD100